MLPDGVSRRKALLGLMDSVAVSNPDIIRQIVDCPDISRPDVDDPPPLLSVFFRFTKFYSGIEKKFFVAFLGDGKSDQETRSQSMRDLLRNKMPPEQTKALGEAVRGSGSSLEVSRHLLNYLSSIFLSLPDGEQVPENVVRVAPDTLLEPAQLANPVALYRALDARKTVESFVAEHIKDGLSVADVAHNFGAAAQGASRALLLMRGKENTEIAQEMLKTPIQEDVIRVALRETTVNGLFPSDDPLIPGRTILALNIGAAATATSDDRFLFGVGSDHRQCPFKNVLYSAAEDMSK